MEPHVFCGPEFVLDVPASSVPLVLEQLRAEAPTAPPASTAASSPSSSPAPDAEAPAPPLTGGASHGWTVQPAALLRVQGELYGVCTAEVRRHVHASAALKACMSTDVRRGMAMVSRRMLQFGRIVLPASYGSLSVSGVPPPPGELTFVEAKATSALSSEETASVQQSVRVAAAASSSTSSPTNAAASASTYVLLYVTDSRVAAQLHMLCLRNTFIALPHGCRLFNYFAATGRAAAVVPSQVLQKRELLRSHFNCDAELWGVLEAKLTDQLVEQVRQSGAPASGSAGRLLTAFEQHEQNVRAVLRYCEQHVRYAGVFDDDEEASPFLLAMGLCWRLGITMDDVCRHFARHPRRVIRALALYLARYTLAPEDYVYVFTPSLCDEVVIACTQDLHVTYAMRELSRQLLTKNDIVDAWLPILAKQWQDCVVAPAVSFMEACWRLQTQPGGSGEDGEGEGGATPSSASAAAGAGASHLFAEADGTAGGRPGEVEAHGEGRGIAAAFGFRSIAEIAEHAAQHARVLVPQSIATILKRRRGLEDDVFGGGEGAGDDADAVDVLGDDEDDDDFLIHVDVRGDEGEAGGGGGRGLALASTAVKRARTGDGRDGTGAGAGGGAVLDPHRRIMREGLKLTLSLLGRRTLFRRDDEHYIEF